MSRGRPGVPRCPARFPRVSGDEPAGDYKKLCDAQFSPRERG